MNILKIFKLSSNSVQTPPPLKKIYKKSPLVVSVIFASDYINVGWLEGFCEMEHFIAVCFISFYND